ncbi:DUF4157 domain-containing protein [Paenibacillus sp. IB182496]|uniref:DUF4157 domain-containing protein n=1 Tax=Paenibacillus sabuli TaxID=2772509 RepID=A0A927BYM0_9BACL|nr:DUF4157 domain-containing protein [Paenibacillus sabuli]MBD2847894.1 DUF4157 domain-containing protein [Paenibacillus sabuli]
MGMLRRYRSAHRKGRRREETDALPLQTRSAAAERATPAAQPMTLAPTHMHHLQRTVGNHAVQQLLRRKAEQPVPLVTPKLQIGAVHDPQEQQADQIAYRVVREINTTRPSDTTIQPSRSQSPAEMTEAESEHAAPGWTMLPLLPGRSKKKPQQKQAPPKVQMTPQPHQHPRQWAGGAFWQQGQTVEQLLARTRGNGDPLPAALAQELQQAFGADFSHVVVHTGETADRLARMVGARAFASGRDLYFAQGQYLPHTRGGQQLISHELAHVQQQMRQ